MWLDLHRDAEWLSREVGTDYIPQVLSRMARKGSLFAMGGGRYVVAGPGTIDPSQAVTFAVALDIVMGGRPYYLAYAAAMADHGLIDESVDPIVAVHARAFGGTDSLRVVDRTVHLVRISSERRWFGRERVVEGRAGYWRSDLERTLLDAVDRPDMSGGLDLSARAWERAVREQRVDLDRLVGYALSLGQTPALRAAFFGRAAGLGEVADRILAQVPRTRSSAARVDPTRSFGEGDWRRDRETGLIVNVPEIALSV